MQSVIVIKTVLLYNILLYEKQTKTVLYELQQTLLFRFKGTSANLQYRYLFSKTKIYHLAVHVEALAERQMRCVT